MNVKICNEQIQQILDDPEAARSAKVKVNDPWWLIVVKVIAYICGLILAGAGTVSCSTMVGML